MKGTTLHTAAESGALQAVEAFIKSGTDVNAYKFSTV